MFTQTRDETLFHKFWRDEKNNTPRFFNDASEVWTTTWDDFKGFCDQAERIYAIDQSALLYVQRIGDNANIHFSLIRGEKIDIADLLRIRDELFESYELMFGFVGTHNRGLRRIVEACGLRYSGFEMFFGFSHNKLLQWRCFSLTKAEYLSLTHGKDVVLSA